MVEQVFKSFKSRYVHLSYEEHDLVTANTQAVTHAAFLRYVLNVPLPSQFKSYPYRTSARRHLNARKG